jgi:hypothetical protein
MVTGCVERGTPSPTGTTGSTSASSGDFVLQHATMSSSAGASSSTSSTTSSARPGTTAGTTGSSATNEKDYKLDATAAQLSSHVGHKVEITGELEQPGASASARTSPPSASASASSSSSGEPRLKVDSVRMISTTCS